MINFKKVEGKGLDIFVGAEYIIANALIALKSKGVDKIKVSDLYDLGVRIQKSCDEQLSDIDAVFLLYFSNVSSAIYDFSDYFTYKENGMEGEKSSEPVICLNSDVEIKDLESRFMGYLPNELLKIIIDNAQELRAA